MQHHESHPTLDLLVDALLGWAGCGALILDHMARWESHAPLEQSSYESVRRR